MRTVKIQFVPWDKTCDFPEDNFNLVVGDKVVVKTDQGAEIGTVMGFGEAADDSTPVSAGKASSDDASGKTENSRDVQAPAEESVEANAILRKATSYDLEKQCSKEERKQALQFCREMKDKLGLEMKFIDVHYSFDGSRITFAFIADGRVDFRDLVKELTRHFGRTIRLQQIGIRDEAKVMGDIGHCGKALCCKRFLHDLSSITSEMAELQQCSHRGSDRISGICGRLMCCLAFEHKGYEELAERLAPVGSRVSVDGKKGVVVKHNILKQTVFVDFRGEKGDNNGIVEVDINRHKKKK